MGDQVMLLRPVTLFGVGVIFPNIVRLASGLGAAFFTGLVKRILYAAADDVVETPAKMD